MQPYSLAQQLALIEADEQLVKINHNVEEMNIWKVAEGSIVHLDTTKGPIFLVEKDAIAVLSSANAHNHTTVRIYRNCLKSSHPDYRVGMTSRDINSTRGFDR